MITIYITLIINTLQIQCFHQLTFSMKNKPFFRLTTSKKTIKNMNFQIENRINFKKSNAKSRFYNRITLVFLKNRS